MDKEINCGIYKITNTKNNKVYIGSSKNLNSRKCNHFSYLKNNKHRNTYLQNSYNKHGKENFKFEPIKYIEKIDNTFDLKKELLQWEQYYLDEYIIDKIIDQSRCYNFLSIAGSNLGTKLSEEHKNKIGKSLKGRIKSKQERTNISNSLLGHTHLEETKKKIGLKSIGRMSKKIINITTNDTFLSITEASKFYNINIGSITEVCRGNRKTAGGYEWRYLND